MIGRLLDLSHVSWRTCVADPLADHTHSTALHRPYCRIEPYLDQGDAATRRRRPGTSARPQP